MGTGGVVERITVSIRTVESPLDLETKMDILVIQAVKKCKIAACLQKDTGYGQWRSEVS